MRDGGFTLTEMLAALLILSLAFGGLFEATRLIGRLQAASGRQVAAARASGAAQAGLQSWLGSEAMVQALNDNTLQGDARTLSYPCGAADCRLSLAAGGEAEALTLVGHDQVARRFPLQGAPTLRLVYDAMDGRFDRWPPPGRLRVLRAVSLVRSGDDGDQPVLTARAWIEQAPACQYDMISRACRPKAP